MKFKNLLKTTMCTTLILLAGQNGYSQTRGTVDGGGSDTKPLEEGSAWFLDDNKVINICVDRKSDFILSEDKVLSDIASAFNKWEQYFEKTISTNGYKEIVRTGKNKPTFRYHINKVGNDCLGREDLTFYIGTDTSQTKLVKRKYHNPLALAYRTNFNRAAGWSKGFIWIDSKIDEKKSWDLKEGLFHAAILHELGHVYGNDHKEHTIMTDDLRAFLQSATVSSIQRQLDLLYLIDHNLQLIVHPEIFEGSIDMDACKMVLPFNACEKLSVSYFRSRVKQIDSSLYLLELSEDEKLEIQVNNKNYIYLVGNNTRAFYVFRENVSMFTSSATGYTEIASLTTREGNKLPLLIHRNLSNKIQIQYFDKNAELKTLFSVPWITY